MNGGFLLDTNVPSELTKPTPDVQVRDWVDAQDDGNFRLSCLRWKASQRVYHSSAGQTAPQLERWFEQYILPLFAGRILPVTQSIGNRWGVLGGECQLRGATLNTADGMIAATALEHGLTVVTRNVKDFAGLDVAIFNPWDAV